jgi:hypothetical protein
MALAGDELEKQYLNCVKWVREYKGEDKKEDR